MAKRTKTETKAETKLAGVATSALVSEILAATEAAKQQDNRRGVKLSTFKEMIEFAKWVVEAKVNPKGLETVAAVAIAIEMGAEIGLPPLASVQNIAVINGRPSIWGDAMLGVCLASGLFDHSSFREEIEGEGENRFAVCEVRRKPDGKIIHQEFSIKDAKVAGLWGKQGPWTSFPARMLQMRARTFACRDAFPDVLRGLLSIEETQDIPATLDSPTARVEAVDNGFAADRDEIMEWQPETFGGAILMPGGKVMAELKTLAGLGEEHPVETIKARIEEFAAKQADGVFASEKEAAESEPESNPKARSKAKAKEKEKPDEAPKDERTKTTRSLDLMDKYRAAAADQGIGHDTLYNACLECDADEDVIVAWIQKGGDE